MSILVAAGIDWLGRRVADGAVVYVAAEAGRGIINRVAAFKRAHRYDDDEATIPFAALVTPIDLCHADAGDVDRLVSLICDASLCPLALIVIDTVSRALAGGNENSPDDMGALVRSLDRIRDDLRCHVAAVHHLGKDSSKGGRGHFLLHCAVDTEIEVVRDDGTGVATGDRGQATRRRHRRTDCIQAQSDRTRLQFGRRSGHELRSRTSQPPAQPRKPAQLSPAQAIAWHQLTNAINVIGKVPPA
jgi:hypothetical protein